MSAIEFTTELTEKPVLSVPQDVADRLPKTGKARVIVITNGASDDAEWQAAAYEQFLHDDVPEDAVYDSLR
jgi:ribonucleotide monophosphatase NagD (HAD superfamily)